jgi:hypothetical protein
VEVVAGEKVPGAETEAGREDARVSVSVHHRHVRRVAGTIRAAVEGSDEGEHTLGLADASEPGQAGNGLGDPGQTPARDQRAVEVADLQRIVPAGFVGREVGARQQTTALVGQREEGVRERAPVQRTGAFLGDRLEHRDEPRLV